MSIAKLKTAMKQVTTLEGIPKALVHFVMGFVAGVIADLVFEWVVWNTGFMSGNIDIGFPFYYAHPERTWIAFDDLALLIISIVLLFTKKFFIAIGFFAGYYISANEDLYGALGLPRP